MGRKIKTILFVGKFIALFSSVVIVAHVIHTGTEIALETAGQLVDEAKATVQEHLGTERIVVVSPQEVDTEQLIESISAEFGINPVIVKAMAVQESGHWNRTDRVRFEKHLHGKFKTPAHLNEIEKQFYASSFGILQVIYGFHKERCKLSSYSELLEPAKNIRCSLTILSENLKAAKGKNRLKQALTRYNGSGPEAEKYAEQVLARIGQMMVEG